MRRIGLRPHATRAVFFAQPPYVGQYGPPVPALPIRAGLLSFLYGPAPVITISAGPPPPLYGFVPGFPIPPAPGPPPLPPPGFFPVPNPGPAPVAPQRSTLRWNARMRYVLNQIWTSVPKLSGLDRARIFNEVFRQELFDLGFRPPPGSTLAFPLIRMSAQATTRTVNGTTPAFWSPILAPATTQAELDLRAALDAQIVAAKQTLGIR